jgi:hypothetical protein
MPRVNPLYMKSSSPGLALRSLPALEAIGSNSDLVARSDLGCEFGFTAERSWCRPPQGSTCHVIRRRLCLVYGLDGASRSKAFSSQGPRAFFFSHATTRISFEPPWREAPAHLDDIAAKAVTMLCYSRRLRLPEPFAGSHFSTDLLLMCANHFRLLQGEGERVLLSIGTSGRATFQQISLNASVGRHDEQTGTIPRGETSRALHGELNSSLPCATSRSKRHQT